MVISEYKVADVIEGKTSMEKRGCEKPTEVFKVGITSDSFKNLKIMRMIWAISCKGRKTQTLAKY